MIEYKTKYFTYTTFDEEQMGATPAVFGGGYLKLKGIFRIMDGKLCRVLKGSPPWLTKGTKRQDMGL